MKQITSFYLVLTIGLCLQAPLVFGQEQDQNNQGGKEAKASSDAGKGKPQEARHDQKSQSASHATKGTGNVVQQDQKGPQKSLTSQGDKSRDKSGTAGIQSPTKGEKRNTDLSTQNVQQPNQGQSTQRQTVAITVQGNRSNRYNGQWVAGNTHSDWGGSGYHQWNNHDYRWYDGGWLIIDAGYYQNDSIVRAVKVSLTQDGYYDGRISAHIGPRTREAISHYESDNGLPGDGRINEPLLASLRIE